MRRMRGFRSALPDIYKYSDYRRFLNDYCGAQRAKTATFSQRRWSASLGLKSPAALAMILRGQRNPSHEVVDRMAEYFGFSPAQRMYFETLVKLSRASQSPDMATRYIEQLRQMHPKREMHIIPYDLFAAISNWYCLAIREMVQSADFREDPEWIAKKLRGRLSAKKVSDAIATLLKAGLLKRDGAGRLQPSDADIGTLADTADEAVKRFHEQMIELAAEAIRSVPVEERDISGSTFNIDPNDLPALKEEMRRLRKELYKKYEKPAGSATYQLGFQLIPLTHVQEKK